MENRRFTEQAETRTDECCESSKTTSELPRSLSLHLSLFPSKSSPLRTTKETETLRSDFRRHCRQKGIFVDRLAVLHAAAINQELLAFYGDDGSIQLKYFDRGKLID
jgi:hypothetical protein